MSRPEWINERAARRRSCGGLAFVRRDSAWTKDDQGRSATVQVVWWPARLTGMQTLILLGCDAENEWQQALKPRGAGAIPVHLSSGP
jgi:hypothetical protein